MSFFKPKFVFLAVMCALVPAALASGCSGGAFSADNGSSDPSAGVRLLAYTSIANAQQAGMSLATLSVLRHLVMAGEPLPLSHLAERSSCVRSNMTGGVCVDMAARSRAARCWSYICGDFPLLAARRTVRHDKSVAELTGRLAVAAMRKSSFREF